MERLKQCSTEVQRELRPMGEAIRRARAEQIARYQKNGPHVQIEWLENASHYLFVDKPRDVAARMMNLLDEAHR
jgi:pimeloyl-ACP methyl ester carboxylesterase